MTRKIKNNLIECALAIVMLLIVALGIIASAGAINYGFADEGILFIIAGFAGIPISIYSGVSFYRQFLKPIK